MKRAILFFLFIVLITKVYPQVINSILVPGSSGASFTQASNEFNTYATSYDALTWDASAITSHFGYSISWPEPMLMWNGNRPEWPKWTAFAVIAYAQAYRYETNSTRKSYYETKAKRGAEFLLWLESATGNNGGIPDALTSGSNPPTTGKGPFTTGITGIAFVECYLSFGDQKYYDASIRTAEWQLSNPAYPYNFPGDPKRYYSNVNHLARPVWQLSEVYKITGDQRYLDRAIQIAEEIMAWQDYQDTRDPWGETKNPDGTWDGGWYWYDYSATSPLPSGVETPPGGGFAAERKMDYHTATVYGLIKLLEVTQQQLLPGTTTIRNNVSFTTFRNNLISSIKRALNYMIRYQEVNNGTNTYRGLFKSFKNDRMYGGDATFDGTNTVSAPHGLSTIIDAYLALLKTNSLTSQDQTRLVSLINGVSENMIGRYSGGWSYDEWRTEGMMINWSRCMYYRSLPTINSTLSLVNPSFEDREIKWEMWSWDGSGVNVSSTEARTGTKSIHIVDNSTTAGKWASLLITATPNTTYKAEAYLHLLSGYQALYIHYYDSNYNLIDYNYTLVSPNSSFQKVSVQRTAPTNAAYLRITLYSASNHTSNGYWDDVSLSTILSKTYLEEDTQKIPSSYSIANYPNPFNPTTIINYSLPKKDFVQIRIFNSLGQEIMTLVNSFLDAGKYNVEFNATNLPSGVYFYNLTTSNNSITKKMLLVK